MQAIIARQPIFDLAGRVYGYELLARSGAMNHFSDQDGDAATARLLADSVSVHGLQELSAGQRLFVNVTRQALVEEQFNVLPPGQTVLELLETIEPDDEVVEACRKARRAGYSIALDDFVVGGPAHCMAAEVDVIKVDFLETSLEHCQALARELTPTKTQLLAEKVEDHEVAKDARDSGYTLMQGFFFCKPEVIQCKRLPVDSAKYLQFLNEVNKPEIHVDQLEQLIRQDLSLSYKLLKYLNSAAFGLPRRIESIRHAIILLGDRPLRKWATLIAMQSLGSEKPAELLNTCLIRAQLCEDLGKAAGFTGRDFDLYMMGMFSVIDAMVDRPLDEVLEGMPLSTDVVETLRGGETMFAPVYQLTLAIERGQWDEIDRFCRTLKLSDEMIAETYRRCVQWAHGILGTDVKRKAG